MGMKICCIDDGKGGGASSGPVFHPMDGSQVGDPYTPAELQQHNSKKDCWVGINGKVCNLTEFMARHPGGEAIIMSNAGKDASAAWNALHKPDMIEKIAPETVIGYMVEKK